MGLLIFSLRSNVQAPNNVTVALCPRICLGRPKSNRQVLGTYILGNMELPSVHQALVKSFWCQILNMDEALPNLSKAYREWSRSMMVNAQTIQQTNQRDQLPSTPSIACGFAFHKAVKMLLFAPSSSASTFDALSSALSVGHAVPYTLVQSQWGSSSFFLKNLKNQVSAASCSSQSEGGFQL